MTIVAGERAEQTRARYPDSEGTSSEAVSASTTRSTARASPPALPADLDDHPLAPLEAPAPLLRAAREGDHIRPARERALGPPDRPARLRRRQFAADALAVLDATGTERAVVVSLSLGAQRALLLAAAHPERVAGAVFIGPAAPARRLDGHRAILDRFDEELETDEGWAKQPALLAPRFRRVSRVLLLGVLLGAALDEADRGRRGLGSRHDPRDPARERGWRRARLAGEGRGSPRRSAARPRHPRGGGSDPADRPQGRAGPAHRWGLRRLRRRRPPHARPGEGEPADPRLRRFARRTP